jgi:hypothetical protein
VKDLGTGILQVGPIHALYADLNNFMRAAKLRALSREKWRCGEPQQWPLARGLSCFVKWMA